MRGVPGTCVLPSPEQRSEIETPERALAAGTGIGMLNRLRVGASDAGATVAWMHRARLFAASSILLFATGACAPTKKDLQAELDSVKGQLTQTASERDDLAGQNEDYAKTLLSYDNAVAVYDEALSNSGVKLEELAKRQQMTEQQLRDALEAQAQREIEVATYKRLFKRLKKLIDTGQIKVVFRKGKMVVQLESAVLFDSGKVELKEDGKAALTELSDVLKNEGREFLVAGHTDNVPINTARFKSNWELSTQRAVVVLDFLVEQGFPQKYLAAAGYGEVDPVSSNDTPEGRSNNRRIEVILMPTPAQVRGLRELFAGE